MRSRKSSFRFDWALLGSGLGDGRTRHIWLAFALLAASAPMAVACSDVPEAPASREAAGTLQLGLGAGLDGEQYWLEANFVVSGPETRTLRSVAGETSLVQELTVGSYTVQIGSDFRVLRQTPNGLTAVRARLDSAATQSLTITSQSTSRVAYRFLLDEGSIEFQSGTLEVDFQLAKGRTYLATWGGARWYRVPVRGAMTDANILAACHAAGLSTPCQTQSSCAYNDAQCSPITGETSCGNPMLGIAQELCGAGSTPSTCAALFGAYQYMGGAFFGGCGALSDEWCATGNAHEDADALCTGPLSSEGTGLENATISAPGIRARLFYDAPRRTLYGVDLGNQMLERYRYENGSWRALESLVVPGLADIAPTPDGQLLVVASDNGIGDIQLEAEPPVLVGRVANPDPFCGQHPKSLAMGSDGQALVVFGLRACSGFTLTARYDAFAHTLASNPYPGGMLYEGVAAASGDGRRIYAGSNGVSPAQQITIFDPPAWTASAGPVAYNLNAASVSNDASRVLLQNTDVLDRELAILGHIPNGGVALVSHDSTRAFAYRDDGQPSLVSYALDVPPEAGAIYPQRSSFVLGTTSSGGISSGIALAATPDDSAVFVSLSGSIFVVRVK